MDELIKYRICWLTIKTGATGHGEPIFDTFKEASEVARQLNNELITNWAEQVVLTNNELEEKHID